MEQSWESPQHLGAVAIEKGAFGCPSTTVANFTYLYFKVDLSKFDIGIELCLAIGQKNEINEQLMKLRKYILF